MGATDRSGAGGPQRARSSGRRSKEDRRVSVAQLFEEFLALSEARGRSPTTLHAYRTAIAGFWLPRIGDMEIGELTAHALDTIYAGMLTRDRPAAPSTVRKYHAILSAALAQAVKWQWISVNPARLATLPVAQLADPDAPTPEQVRALIAECTSESEVLGMFVLVAAVTGCRRGELAALRWGDYSDEALRIHGSAYNVGQKKGVKPTKTGRQRRVVVGSHLELALEQWKARCESVAADAGAAFGPECLIFSSTPDGLGAINVNTVTSAFHRVAKRLGLSSLHLHSLRHFAATQLISAGVDPRTAASRLGHANPSMTLRVYAHSTSETEQRAAEVGASVLIEPH
jgi:integrase